MSLLDYPLAALLIKVGASVEARAKAADQGYT